MIIIANRLFELTSKRGQHKILLLDNIVGKDRKSSHL